MEKNVLLTPVPQRNGSLPARNNFRATTDVKMMPNFVIPIFDLRLKPFLFCIQLIKLFKESAICICGDISYEKTKNNPK
jgi:hypothetical protein